MLQVFSPVERIHLDIAYRSLDRMSSPIEFFSYALFYSSIIFGPCFEIKHYLKCMDGSIFTAVSVPGAGLIDLEWRKKKHKRWKHGSGSHRSF